MLHLYDLIVYLYLVAIVQRLLQCVCPKHGRVLIYVWAIEQDELSKRTVPTSYEHTGKEPGQSTDAETPSGEDVFVPWVLPASSVPTPKNTRSRRQNVTDVHLSEKATPKAPPSPMIRAEPRILNRYYHMFARGELLGLVHEAARELDLHVGAKEVSASRKTASAVQGLEVVQSGWERSNYYVEVRRWQAM
jgi:tRNA (uracil-5-)-methyltransferase TRM9